MGVSKNMLDRLWRWKNRRTVLRLTLLTRAEAPKVVIGKITGIDDELMQVGFGARQKLDCLTLNLLGATFSLGKLVLEVTRSPEDRLMFEELESESCIWHTRCVT
jgi:hypothetical protein